MEGNNQLDDDDSIDEENEEWEAERQRERDEAMRKIETNDPTFTTLKIEYEDEDGWEELGMAIGRNTQLTNVILHSHLRNIPAIHVREFVRGLKFNRSIKKLKIASGWNHSDHEAWEHLTRFFIDNEAFECLKLVNLCWNVKYHRELISALQSFASLKEFTLSSGYDPGYSGSADDVIDALIEHHTCLRKLTIQGFCMGRGGCAALTASSLIQLHLQYGVQINEEGARAFATGLARNTTLKELKIIHSSNISDISWQSIFTAFSTCKVENLIMDSNGLNDANLQSLSNALLHNTFLKSLILMRIADVPLAPKRLITNAGWFNLFTSLRRIMLEKLDISYNSIGDIGITVIAESLENNSCLRELRLSGNSISGAGVNSLTNALEHNCILKELSIDGQPVRNPAVTTAGWVDFSTVLRNPTSALEVLCVSNDSINDEVIQSFADALANNNKLRELNIFTVIAHNHITPDGYAAMTNILCDTSSILSTYHSNHTLEELCHKSFASPFPNDLSSLLQINRESSVSQAARLKIINSHFSGSEINMQPFMEMNLNVRPHAIAWMAKDMHMYELLRAMPSLLEQFEDHVIRSKKRTRNI